MRMLMEEFEGEVKNLIFSDHYSPLVMAEIIGVLESLKIDLMYQTLKRLENEQAT